MHNLAGFGGHFVDPFDADDEDQLGLARHVEVAFLLGEAREANLLALCISVFLNIGFGALEDDSTLLLLGL